MAYGWGAKVAEGSLSRVNLNLPKFDLSEQEFPVFWEHSVNLVGLLRIKM